jgi:tetratricopeptide (TPR) repeat protein
MDRLSQLREFHRQDPDNDALALELIDALLAAGQPEEAQQLVDSAPDAWLVRPEFLFRAGRCALARADYASAMEPLRMMLDGGVDEPGVRHDLAYALLGSGDVDGAEDVLAPLVPQSVAIPSIGLLHARVLHYRRRFDDAALILEAIVGEQPNDAQAWGLLAMVEVDRSGIEAAAFAAGRSLALSSNQPDALAAAGTLGLMRFDADVSYEAFTQLLVTQPHNGRALAGAGEALLLKGDPNAARPLLEKASHAMPEHLGTWHALAWAALLEGDLVAAQSAFASALAADRNFGESHGGIALVHAIRGEFDEARQGVRVAMRLDPGGRNARYAQSLIWRSEGREREAEAMVDGILAEAGIDAAGRPADFIARLQTRIQGHGAA